MKTIHKFRLEVGSQPTSLTLREGHRVVRCEYIVPDKAVYIWIEQPLNVGIPSVERQFRVVYSGQPVADSNEYIGTALDPFGPEAYHVFEIPVGEHQQEVYHAVEGGGDQFQGRELHQARVF